MVTDHNPISLALNFAWTDGMNISTLERPDDRLLKVILKILTGMEMSRL